MPTTAVVDTFARFVDTATTEDLHEFCEATSLVRRVVIVRRVVPGASLATARDTARYLEGGVILRGTARFEIPAV